MQNPTLNVSLKTKICKKLVSIRNHWFLRYILIPIFFILPPTILTLVATKNNLQEQLKSLPIFGEQIYQFTHDTSLLIIVFTYIYFWFGKVIFTLIKHWSKPEKELSRDDILSILKVLNLIVNDKAKRFSNHLKSSSASNNAGDTFQSITMPDQQLGLIIAGIRSMFEMIDNENTSYKVGLMSVYKKKPHEWVVFDPIDQFPSVTPRELSSPTSTISHCIKTRDMVVVEDIKKELLVNSKSKRRYVKGANQPDTEGSQMCYPLVHSSSGNIEYVLSIAGDKKKCLYEKHAPLYKWILDHFALRISMEHSLLVLKEKANEQP